MGLPIGYGFTHDFALCRSAGAVRHFHRLRHAFSVQMVWYLSLTYGQAHRLSSGTPSACLFYTQKIRNGAVHTLFDSFATAPFSRTLFPKIFDAKYSLFRLHFAIFLSGKRQKNGIANAGTAEQSLQMFLGKGVRGKGPFAKGLFPINAFSKLNSSNCGSEREHVRLWRGRLPATDSAQA